MDMSTHLLTLYLDIRIRVFFVSRIQTFYLLAFPMFTRHIGEQIFIHATEVLDCICPQWKIILLSITTDGERKMTGHIQGVSTRFEQAAQPGFSKYGVDIINWI